MGVAQRTRRSRPISGLAERLLASGQRLCELRDVEAVCRFLADETKAVSAARRVLLVLGSSPGHSAAAARVPRGEDPRALHAAVASWLDEAARTRATALRHGPEGVPAAAQRSCLVAPLATATSVLGVLYADVEGSFGRFEASECDAIALLAAQGASAIERLRREQVLARENARLLKENVRLFNETKQALDRQTAMADVLQVIGRSMTDSRPVFEAILERCEGLFADPAGSSIVIVGEDGLLRTAAFQLTGGARSRIGTEPEVER